jgi:protein-tyrosine phosphatase
MNVLMVCLGNICRSPLAEGILAGHLARLGLPGRVDSAGLIDYHAGEPPDPRSVATARKHGLDISGQRARMLAADDFENFDLILAMDLDVYDEVLRRTPSPGHRAKVHLFLHYAGYEADRIVPDPYYGGHGQFDRVYRMIEDGCGKIVQRLR